MRIEREIAIEASPRAAWRVLGERFGHIGDWAAPITASSLEGEPRVGAVRTCHIARFGPVAAGVVRERLIAFDPEAMSFTYEVVDGMPSFVVSASNHWSVHDREDGRCRVRMQATFEIRGVAMLLAPLLRWQMQAAGARVLAELAHQIEHGRPHPRKLAAIGVPGCVAILGRSAPLANSSDIGDHDPECPNSSSRRRPAPRRVTCRSSRPGGLAQGRNWCCVSPTPWMCRFARGMQCWPLQVCLMRFRPSI